MIARIAVLVALGGGAAIAMGGVLSCWGHGEIAVIDCDDTKAFPAGVELPEECRKHVSEACSGECRPIGPPDDWEKEPVLLWHGLRVNAPDCPGLAMSQGWFGRDPIIPLACPFCQCDKPACVLPDGLITNPNAGCGPPGPYVAFPPMPDGSCSDKASFAPNAIQSVAVLPPEVTPCKASMVEMPADIARENWNTLAILCSGNARGSCEDSANQLCVPKAPPGFKQCLMNRRFGYTLAACPPAYPHRHVYYKDIDWQVTCTACECAPPAGSVCKAEVTAYTNNACTNDSVFLDVTVSPKPGPPACYPVPPNTALKGLTETWTINQPGACDPIPGSLTGSVAPLESSAKEFCCAEPDDPDPGGPVP